MPRSPDLLLISKGIFIPAQGRGRPRVEDEDQNWIFIPSNFLMGSIPRSYFYQSGSFVEEDKYVEIQLPPECYL
jgi:hypothetical protein